MTTLAHTDVLDNGLNTIIGASPLKLCVCQTEPLTLADCTTLSGSGGKRVTTEAVITAEPTLQNSVNANSRKIVIPSKVLTNGVLVAVSAGTANLWLAVYDGTRLLLKSDVLIDRELIVNDTATTPTFEFGISQV